MYIHIFSYHQCDGASPVFYFGRSKNSEVLKIWNHKLNERCYHQILSERAKQSLH